MTAVAPLGLLWRTAIGGLCLLAATAAAEAACVAPSAPTQVVAADPAGWCLAGRLAAAGEQRVEWSVPATGLWQAALEVLPGETGLALLTRAGSAQPLWRGTTSPASGTATSLPLLLTAGSYTLVLGAGATPTVYRLRLEPAALPAVLPSNGGVGQGVARLEGADRSVAVPWTVPATPPGELWTFTAQLPPGTATTLTLLNAEGRTVHYTDSADAAGTYRLPDLRLLPGAYRLVLASVAAGTPILIGASAEPRPDHFAAEPDSTAALAHPLTLTRPLTGRLASNGTYAEADVFMLELPPAAGPRRIDLSLVAAAAAPLTLALIDAEGRVLLQGEGARQVSLNGVGLAPGRHFVRVGGALPLDTVYTLLAEDAGPAVTGVEAEPNDVPSGATPLPAEGILVGTFGAGDRDTVVLGVTGGLQVWDIEAMGAGIERLSLFDGGGQAIASEVPARDGTTLRLSHLLLPPGSNLVRLDGSGENWLLRATALGPPVPGEEIEPNDDPTRALPLEAGRTQTGWLDRSDDRDLYVFHLAAAHRVRLTLDAPADFPVRVTMSWGEVVSRVATVYTLGGRGTAQTLDWQGLLPPGDFFVELRAEDGATREPYRLELAFPNYFDRPADLEPNDNAWQAAPLPAGQPLAGVLQSDAADWIALDPALAGRTLAVRALALTGWTTLRLATGDPLAPTTVSQIDLDEVGETAMLALPASGAALLRITGPRGPYAFELGASAVPAAPAATATLTFVATPVAAFETVAQRLTGTLAVRNTGPAPLRLRASVWLGDERWALTGLPAELVVPAGRQAAWPVTLEIPARAPTGTVLADLALAAPTGAPLTARAEVAVVAGVDPVGAHADAPMPAAMLGGLNLAWSVLGGRTDDTGLAGLVDGIVDASGTGLSRGAPVIIRLAAPAPLAGVILQQPPGVAPADRLADFAIEIAADGTNFVRVLAARLSPLAREQAFAFPAPVTAAAIRLVPLSAHGGPGSDRPRLAELQVIADPAFVLEPRGFDIAAVPLGGHVVRTTGFGEQALTGENAVWPDSRATTIPAGGTPPEWVLGFLNGRAARVASLNWVPRADTPAAERIAEVEVAVSAAGALGPWTVVGRWRVGGATPAALTLPAPVWARAVSFRVVSPLGGRLTMPERIELREAPGPSILGAWGDLARAGPYEAAMALVAPPAPGLLASIDPAAPTPLALGATATGVVRRGTIEHWYAIDLPAGTRTLRASFAGGLSPEVGLALVAPDGREIPFTVEAAHGTLAVPAGPGPWRVRVTQPRASVVVAWDTSASISAFYLAVARMIRQLGGALDPDAEEANLLPFRGEGSTLLMPAWSGEAADVFAALHAYPLTDSSSDAESALRVASQALERRIGARAVVLVTDAAFSGVYGNEALWASLDRGRPRVFALHLPVDANATRARAQLNLMADWASAAGGMVARFASQGDAEAAYREVAAWLARPARYAFALNADTSPLPPGALVVQATAAPSGATTGASTLPAMALEIVLDASGSMLQRIGDRTRIDIAKSALRDLGAILPAGLPVALRVFGHDRPESCESALFVPLGAFDREAFLAAVGRVQSVNLARTSIAASLRLAGQDLAAAGGERVIVLVTDGEETCGGDPLAEIERLRAGGIAVTLNIVGFAIGDVTTRRLFESWATAGGGQYFDAVDPQALAAAVREAAAPGFEVRDESGAVVARGIVGGPAVTLPPGRYVVRVGAEDVPATIRPGATETVTAGAP